VPWNATSISGWAAGILSDETSFALRLRHIDNDAVRRWN
jgi:hypothetical protein